MATHFCQSNPRSICKSVDGANEKHIKRILDKSKYTINEARYNLVTDEFMNDDNVPEEIWATPQPATNSDSNIFAEDDEELDPQEEPNADAGEEQIPNDTLPPESGDVSVEPVKDLPNDEIPNPEDVAVEQAPEVVQEPSVDELQNDIIRLNISAMQKMNSKVDELGEISDLLNIKLDQLNKDVEEVKEPTNVEKLVSRKEDSHPYYRGLNDMWEGNWFQARQDGSEERGMKQLDNGSYVADFDTLNKFTDQEVKDSFDR